MAEDNHSRVSETVRRSGGELRDEGLVVEIPRKAEVIRIIFHQLGAPSDEQEAHPPDGNGRRPHDRSRSTLP